MAINLQNNFCKFIAISFSNSIIPKERLIKSNLLHSP